MRIILTLILLLGLSGAFHANAQSAPEGKSKEKTVIPEGSEQVKLKISGMTCAGCASSLSKVLSKTGGILDNSVEYPGDIAVVVYDGKKITRDEIIKTIGEKTNFTAELYKEKKG